MKGTLIYPVFILYIILSVAQSFAGEIYFVNKVSVGNEDGKSWENAFLDLNTALDRAVSGDTIWVSAGTYHGGFSVKEGVVVFGGFSGSETTPEERKFPGTGKNLTILDGENKQQVLTQSGNFAIETVWDGFVIQRGVAVNGGGASLFRNMTLRRCIIYNNTAGIPALGSYNAKAGGVVFKWDEETWSASVIATENCGRTFQTGVSGLSAKKTLEQALTDIDGSLNSQQLLSGRAIQMTRKYRAEGIASLYEDWYIPSAGEWSCFVTGRGNGGKRTSLFEQVENTLIKNGKTPLGNETYWSSTAQDISTFPAAWYVDLSSGDINTINIWQYRKIRPARTFKVPYDEGQGGGIYAYGSRIEGCLFHHNIAPEGSGVYARGNVEIINCTFVDNRQSSQANTSALNAQVIDAGTDVRIINTILAGNMDADEQEANWDSDISATYSAIETSLSIPGEGNISLPVSSMEFVDMASGNYRLKESSPSFATGNTSFIPEMLTTDLDGTARITNGKVNMGAFESLSNTGIHGMPTGNFAVLYPNPVKSGSQVTIDLSHSSGNPDGVKIVIMDMLGNILQVLRLDKPINSVQIPVTAGVYLIRLIHDNGEHKEYKIVVTN